MYDSCRVRAASPPRPALFFSEIGEEARRIVAANGRHAASEGGDSCLCREGPRNARDRAGSVGSATCGSNRVSPTCNRYRQLLNIFIRSASPSFDRLQVALGTRHCLGAREIVSENFTASWDFRVTDNVAIALNVSLKNVAQSNAWRRVLRVSLCTEPDSQRFSVLGACLSRVVQTSAGHAQDAMSAVVGESIMQNSTDSQRCSRVDGSLNFRYMS
jgi:hypothetical protein